ncbi:ERCC4 domain-containing protein [Anaerocolumna sp.]|uniref:ERCC4 domain-containing protein n=1 Tax=Anaerocolumna sp. TaxID=2041569 RepID=UPI0028AC3259|nr:ERCC4 domain-containing protein [Anaerocolumna sp.]
MSLTIQIDSREKARAIKKIVAEFELQGVKYYVSKLWTGDYMSLDNPRLIIDRKQNLSEICANVCQSHDRFRNELIRAQENGIKLIILIEHSNQIKSIDDVETWENPRRKKRLKTWIEDELVVDEDGSEYWEPGRWIWEQIETKAMTGETLAKVMRTMERKYGCEFLFCDKLHTGKRIIEILGGEHIDQRTD